ncbi:HEAT repeat-containing protein 6 [Blomia tropicalis]|nr:HEAT repeat-containing protein 6 [Blomia tropicalis]
MKIGNEILILQRRTRQTRIKQQQAQYKSERLPPQSQCIDESIMYLREDVEAIATNLQSIPIDNDNDLRRTKLLLETLSSLLINIKTNHGLNCCLNFIGQLQQIDSFLFKLNKSLVEEQCLLRLQLLLQVENLTLKIVHNLLKITNEFRDNRFGKLLENWLDYLIQIRNAICNTQEKSDLVVQFDMIALSLLKCIFFVSTKCEFQIDELNLTNVCGKFIGILRCFSFYGLENYNLNKLSIQLYPSPVGQFLADDRLDGSSPKKRRGKQIDDSQLLDNDECLYNTSGHISSFSTSEYSSSELEDHLESGRTHKERQHNKKMYGKIRMLAYESIQASLTLFGIRVVFGFWSSLFPDSPNSTEYSVLWTITHDNANRVRTSALNFIFNFFNFGKIYIQTLVNEPAQMKLKSTSSFTPLSVSLASMVRELHHFFDQILFCENNSIILILIYKVVSLTVSITPYDKLATEILHPLFYRNSFLLDHKLTQIKNLSLVLFGRIFQMAELPKQFRLWLVSNLSGFEVMSKIFNCCFQFISNPDYNMLGTESIKLLQSILKHHDLMIELLQSEKVQINLNSLCKISIETIQCEKSLTNPIWQIHICKYVHTLGSFLKHVSMAECSIPIYANDEEKQLSIKKWFLEIFYSNLFKSGLIERNNSIVKSSSQVPLINVISLIPENVFNIMDQNTRYYIVSILTQFAKDDLSLEATNNEQHNQNQVIYTKSAAIRCLSILHSFKCLSDDMNLTSDLIELCLEPLECSDDNCNRSKNQKKKEIFLIEHSSWALANICNVVKKNNLELEVEFRLFERIVVCLHRCCYETGNNQYQTDDILVNLVRCAGIVIYIILYRQQLEDSNMATQIEPQLLLQIIERLLDYLTTKRLYKLQWNICIALSYVLPLDSFIRLSDSAPELLPRMFDSLLKIYDCTPNHKVQSYSIYTIMSITDMNHYRMSSDKLNYNDLLSKVVDKFTIDYHTVPIHSQQSWIEKYLFALERLFQNSPKPSSIDVDKLSNFIRNELKITTENSDANDCSQNKSSIEQLRKFDGLLSTKKST